jgi:hypothetical protein
MYHESMSITVQQDATIYNLLYFCKLLTLHVSGGKSTHHLGVKVFNRLPIYIKKEFDNSKKFKHSLKNFLKEKSFY